MIKSITFSFGHTEGALMAVIEDLRDLTLSLEEKHGHFHFDHKKLNFTFGNEVWKSFQKLEFGEIRHWKVDSFCHQVSDCLVEYFQSEKLFDKLVILKKRPFQIIRNDVLIYESALSWKVLINDSEDGEDVFPFWGLDEEFIVDSEHGHQEFSGKREVEFRILSNQLCNYWKHIKHLNLNAVIGRLILS
jgi:hypothetical protein